MSGSYLPDLNGPPNPVTDLNAHFGGPNLAGFDHVRHAEDDMDTQLTLGPLTRELIMTDNCVPAAGPNMDPYIPLVNPVPSAPTFGVGPFGNDDPFNLSLIIRRLADQDKVNRRKRLSRRMGKGCRNGPRQGDIVNLHGKRSLIMVACMEGMQVGKHPCFPYASSCPLIGSAVVGEAQPRREP